jgi:hypothetical protein
MAGRQHLLLLSCLLILCLASAITVNFTVAHTV